MLHTPSFKNESCTVSLCGWVTFVHKMFYVSPFSPIFRNKFVSIVKRCMLAIGLGKWGNIEPLFSARL
ncbi:Uncharacterized protein APZ42_006317 [Daphnia magna]|uniref:Uncharacterized protein n=1 Tax=Daphnia magna TaxID=35525 RepID=A0A162BW97_9CRUS|nr:Uncharacterized protein APZ42_006317 [Daphnia magna]